MYYCSLPHALTHTHFNAFSSQAPKISKEIWRFQIASLSQALLATRTHNSCTKNFAMHLIWISLAAGHFHCFLLCLLFEFFYSHLRRA